jgi:hypothetical protein
MLQFILSLFGCKKAPTITTTSQAAGPFTIETITEKGKTYNLNYGRVNYTTISYDVKYKGEPLQLGDQLETNTGLPGIWRVFSLKDAPAPTLLLGSQSLYLVTLENDKPAIKPLYEQGSDFASIQWLDSEAGQPGAYREIFSSDEFDTETELSGGRYMAISHAVVLDTKTKETFPYNTNNESVEGYGINGWNVIGFSPDSTQLIHRGYRYDSANYEIIHLALLVYNFKTGERYAVPFDKYKLKLKNDDKITPEWIADYFEWKPMEDGKLKLAARPLDTLPYQKGILFFERNKGYSYTLDPVKESMLEHLSAFIQAELKLDPSAVYRMDGDYLNRLYIKYGDITLMLIYGEYREDLVLRQDAEIDIAVNKEIMTRLGKGFNAILSTGKYEVEWNVIAPEKEE